MSHLGDHRVIAFRHSLCIRPHAEHYVQELTLQSTKIDHDKSGPNWLDVMLQNDSTGTLYDTLSHRNEEDGSSVEDSFSIIQSQK